MRRKPQPDNQPPVTEDLLFIAKDRVCKLRVKACERLGLFLVGLNYREMDSVIGVTGPYRGGIPISSSIIKQKKGAFQHTVVYTRHLANRIAQTTIIVWFELGLDEGKGARLSFPQDTGDDPGKARVDRVARSSQYDRFEFSAHLVLCTSYLCALMLNNDDYYFTV